ncbi:hypothetical protein [Salmonella enterica]
MEKRQRRIRFPASPDLSVTRLIPSSVSWQRPPQSHGKSVATE